jgi:hypothetical protein
MKIEPKSCPFCGELPIVLPAAEDVKSGREGGAYSLVECQNAECSSRPSVWDGEDVCDDRGSEKYKEAAVTRWNKRYA